MKPLLESRSSTVSVAANAFGSFHELALQARSPCLTTRPGGEQKMSGITRTVEEDNILKPGEHSGTITKIEERSGTSKAGKEYHYIDVYIESEDKTIKAGYPDKLAPNSMLGKLLASFNTTVLPGGDIDIEGSLVGRKVTFQTVTNPDGYANVQRETLLPIDNSVTPASLVPKEK